MGSGSTRRSTACGSRPFRTLRSLIVDDGSTDAATVRKLESIDDSRTRGFPDGEPRTCLLPAIMRRPTRAASCSAHSTPTTGLPPPGSRRGRRCSTSTARRSHSFLTGSRRSATSTGRGNLNGAICRRCSSGTRSTAPRWSDVRHSRPSAGTTNPCATAVRTGTSGCAWSRRAIQGTIIPEVLFYYRRHSTSMSRGMITRPGHPEAPLRDAAGQARPAFRDHLATVIVSRESRAFVARTRNRGARTRPSDRARARPGTGGGGVACVACQGDPRARATARA